MKLSKWLCFLAVLHAVAASGAQGDAPSKPGGNAHDSAFTGYRRFVVDEPLVDWRAANDSVREGSGASGSAKSEPATAKEMPPAAKAGQSAHEGHKP